jgi:hypothetical protein
MLLSACHTFPSGDSHLPSLTRALSRCLMYHFSRVRHATETKMASSPNGRALVVSHCPVNDTFRVHSGASRLTSRLAVDTADKRSRTRKKRVHQEHVVPNAHTKVERRQLQPQVHNTSASYKTTAQGYPPSCMLRMLAGHAKLKLLNTATIWMKSMPAVDTRPTNSLTRWPQTDYRQYDQDQRPQGGGKRVEGGRCSCNACTSMVESCKLQSCTKLPITTADRLTLFLLNHHASQMNDAITPMNRTRNTTATDLHGLHSSWVR